MALTRPFLTIVTSFTLSSSKSSSISLRRSLTPSNTKLNTIAMEMETATFPSLMPPPKRSDDDEVQPDSAMMMDLSGIAFSGLKGQALSLTEFPKASEIRAVIPSECFELDTMKSLSCLAISTVGTAFCTAVGMAMLTVLNPSNPLTWPIWSIYSAVTGTVAMGLWVLAHECGHGAFSKNRALQDTVGYVIHSIMLVPYYSWQRSHAVHHQYTNHMELGETHVPEASGDSMQRRMSFLRIFGKERGMQVWGSLQTFLHLVIGWPAYLLIRCP